MKYLFAGLIIIFSVLLNGCAEHVDAKPIITQEILLEKCSDDTPLPKVFRIDENGQKGYDGKEAMKIFIAWDAIYFDCASKHDALINAIRKLQDQDIKVSIKVKE